MVSSAALYTLATGSAALGILAVGMWLWLERRVSDDRVRQVFLLYAVSTLALFLSEIVFIARKNLALAEIWEYYQYFLIIIGFFSFAYATKTELNVSQAFGFGERVLKKANFNLKDQQLGKRQPQKKGVRQRQKGL